MHLVTRKTQYAMNDEMKGLQKTQNKGNEVFALALGVLHRQEAHAAHQCVFFNPHLAREPGVRDGGLKPDPSLLEGAGISITACAATTLIHYTPPPFIEGIVPLVFRACQAFPQNSLGEQ